MVVTGIEDLYMGVIKAAIANHPRSLQKRIGPSELGKPCDRWLAHKLHGDDEPDRGPAWKPAIGTAVHAQLEAWFDAANPPSTTPGDVTGAEWVTEWEVCVGTIGPTRITGHSDLFHVPTGTVLDHKIVGPKTLAKYRLHGPSAQYRTQAHLYGKGFTDQGGWGPAREVAICFLPRDGELSQAYIWHEPYNPHVAQQALDRAGRVWTMLQVVGLDQTLASMPLCEDQWCFWCKRELRARDRAAGASLFDVPPATPTVAPHMPAAAVAVPPSPLCTVCGRMLPAAVIADGFSTHPSCDDHAPAWLDARSRARQLAPVVNLFDR